MRYPSSSSTTMLQAPVAEQSESHSPSPSPVGSTNSAGENTFPDDSKIPYLVTAARCRTPVACDKCRERKTKCSGEKPVCDRCSSRGLICIYASRDAKRRVHSQTPGPSSRHARGSSAKGRLCIAMPDNVTDSVSSTTASNSSHHHPLPPSHTPSSSEEFSPLCYSSLTPLNLLRHRIRRAYPTGFHPSVGSLIGGVGHNNGFFSNASTQPPSYHNSTYNAPESEYHPAKRSNSSESGGDSSLGSAPRTPPDGSPLASSGLETMSNSLSYPPTYIGIHHPSPFHLVRSSEWYLDPQPHSYFGTGSTNNFLSELLSPAPAFPSQAAQYDRAASDHTMSGPPHQKIGLDSPNFYSYAVSNSDVMVGAVPSSLWPKAARTSSVTSPRDKVAFDQGSLQGGSLHL
ncbi:hypothetical protein E1B28_009230 [Marasmius oreades]|uniref:Zn(2)-C6 fungal-type domain-containing protein n=1 Tax=Marasmius oreades TaxID=181124 RepID=A0A9P7S090_9AGAR|nr:uncharacterized protein E1B28_009230 [Marasmius oreades]KAG7092925.1 hypothetical protein E1B28_009230 [Marasmius oreades]